MIKNNKSPVALNVMIQGCEKPLHVFIGPRTPLLSQPQLIGLLVKAGRALVEKHRRRTCLLTRYNDIAACYQVLDLAKRPDQLGLTAGNTYMVKVMFSSDTCTLDDSRFLRLITDSELADLAQTLRLEYAEGAETDSSADQWVTLQRRTTDGKAVNVPEDMVTQERAILVKELYGDPTLDPSSASASGDPDCKTLDPSSGYGTGNRSSEVNSSPGSH